MARCGARGEDEEVLGQLREGSGVMGGRFHLVQRGDKGLTLASLECELEGLVSSWSEIGLFQTFFLVKDSRNLP